MDKVTTSPAKLHGAQRRSPSKASGHPQQPSTEALATDTKQQAVLRRGLRWLAVVSALAAAALLYPAGRILRHRAPVSAAAPTMSGDVFQGCNPQLSGFVLATTTNSQRHELIKASRGHRQGVRMVVVTNITGPKLEAEAAAGMEHCEEWRHFPDKLVVVEGFPRPLVGELRLANTPFLVHQWLGNDTFEWLIYGDDDTLWFLDGVISLAKQFDPELPWFLTDNYYSNFSPGFGPRKAGVPRCLPCTMDAWGLDVAALRAVQTCNCTPLAVCGGSWNQSTDYHCDPERPPLEGNHGGAGALLSVGLMRRAPLAAVKPCLDDHPEWLGDHAFFHCLWRAGYAHTDPGHAAQHQGSLLFDALDGRYHELARLANRSVGGKRGGPGRSSEGAPQEGAGASSESAILHSMVSMHLSAGRYCSTEAAAQVMAHVYQLYDAWREASAGVKGAAQRVGDEAGIIPRLLPKLCPKA